MYTYEVSEDLVANIYSPDGNLIDYPGPFRSAEEAEEWATLRVSHLNTYGETHEDSK
jgi:roadblock/LC7 domain-containing protein